MGMIATLVLLAKSINTTIIVKEKKIILQEDPIIFFFHSSLGILTFHVRNLISRTILLFLYTLMMTSYYIR